MTLKRGGFVGLGKIQGKKCKGVLGREPTRLKQETKEAREVFRKLTCLTVTAVDPI